MKILILGGNAAGMSCATKLKRNNPDFLVSVYEQSNIVSFGNCGLPYFIGNFFTDPDLMIARTKAEFVQQGIAVYTLHSVLKVDSLRKIVIIKNLESNEIIEENYDKLVITTGSSARISSIPEKNLVVKRLKNKEFKHEERKKEKLQNIYSLKTLEDALALKILITQPKIKNISIIGGGYIGLEMLDIIKHFDKTKNITLIESSNQLLKQSFDPEFVALLNKELLENNITLYLNEQVQEFIGSTSVTQLKTQNRVIKTDLIIQAVGVIPNTGFLNNLQFNKLSNQAIIINKFGQTNIDDIYAAGDCASVFHKVSKQNTYIPLATTANKLGKTIADHISGKNTTFNGTLGSASIKVLNLELARCGILESQAQALKLSYKILLIKDYNHTNYYPNQELIEVKVIYDNTSLELLGAQIIGKNDAVLRMHALSVAIDTKLKITELANLDFAYSPPFSRPFDILNIIGSLASSKINNLKLTI